MTKKGRNPANKPIIGIAIKDSSSEKTKFVKYRMEITITKINFGINEDTVSP